MCNYREDRRPSPKPPEPEIYGYPMHPVEVAFWFCMLFIILPSMGIFAIVQMVLDKLTSGTT